MNTEPHSSAEVFYSYAHEDEALRDELKKHLSNLKRQGVITDWYDRDISAGKEWDDEIKQHLNSAKVILLLISPDFMDSDYINDVEVKHAMERHESGEARVIPVILRPVDWQGAPFSKLQALPTDAKSVTSWDDPDEAFLDITKGIRRAIQELSGLSVGVPAVPDIPRPPKVGFVSRRDKDSRDIVSRLREELAPQKNQLVALWGAGGVGKTTLAAEAVRELAELYNQRIIWISADARPNFVFSTLLDDIAEQLGRTDLRPLAIGHKEEALRPLIAAKPTLIVLDNSETIAPDEELLCKEFLAKRVHCPALITTRERIDDTYLIPLAAMAPDEAEELLKRLILQSPDPDIYDVTQRAHILQTAEYNPLIIQWIVAQIDLAQDPEEVLTDLALGEGDAAHRVFDRSYNLPQLNDGGRAVLLALALFTTSAGRPTLAAVAGMDLGKKKDKDRFKKAQEVLASLWLIKKMDGGLRLAVDGLTRELARKRLSGDPRSKPYRLRYVARFLHFLEAHVRPTPEDYDALEIERENVLNAIDEAFDFKDWKTVQRMVDLLTNMLGVRGYWDEELRRGEQAMEAARLRNDRLAVAQFAGNIATVHAKRGEYNHAKLAYEEALSVFRSMGHKGNIANCLHNLAIIAHHQGDVAEASRLFNEALEIRKTLGDQFGFASTIQQLGSVAQDLGELDEARRLYNESLEIRKQLKDSGGIARSLHDLAIVAQLRGEFSDADRLYHESLDIKTRLGDQHGIAITLHQLATLFHETGQVEEAESLIKQSLEINEKLGDLTNIASAFHQLAMLAQHRGQLDEARRYYNDSINIKRKIGDQSGIAGTLHQLGILSEQLGKPDEATHFFNESLDISRNLGEQRVIASSLAELGRLAKLQGNDHRAIQFFAEALDIFVRINSPNADIVRRNLDEMGNQ